MLMHKINCIKWYARKDVHETTFWICNSDKTGDSSLTKPEVPVSKPDVPVFRTWQAKTESSSFWIFHPEMLHIGSCSVGSETQTHSLCGGPNSQCSHSIHLSTSGSLALPSKTLDSSFFIYKKRNQYKHCQIIWEEEAILLQSTKVILHNRA